jgi:hypothetical protein
VLHWHLPLSERLVPKRSKPPAPKKPKELQLLVQRLPVSDCAHGCRKGGSVKTAAEPHVRKRVILHMDLKDFFHTVTFAQVRGLLIALGYGYPVATVLAVLRTEAPRQPVEVEGTLFHVPVGDPRCVQGAPTSRGLCNSMALRMDRRLAGLARWFGFTYSRYVVDLAFSGNATSCLHGLRVKAT